MALEFERTDIESVTLTFHNGESMVITDPENAIVRERSLYQDNKPTIIEWEVRWTEK